MEYNPLNNEIVRTFCQRVEDFSHTSKGRTMLQSCGLDRIIVRGSASFILSSESKLFERTPGDLDLRIVSAKYNSSHKVKTYETMPIFLKKSMEGTNITTSVDNPQLSGIEFAQNQLLPKQDFWLHLNTTRPILSLHVNIG
jgi:hypothetical protein